MAKKKGWERLQLRSETGEHLDTIDDRHQVVKEKAVKGGRKLEDKDWVRLHDYLGTPQRTPIGTETKIQHLKKGGLVKGYGKAVKGTKKCRVR